MKPIDQLPNELRRFRQRAERQAIPAALDDAAGKVLDEAKQAAPVQTGALRESLTSERQGLAVRIGAAAGATNADGAPVDEYGEQVEYAQPYLRPALDNAGPHLEKALRKRLEQAADGS